MPEYRSYARQGQFTNTIQAPNTAKAKRDRDKEFVKELKEENQALKDRDAKFLAAYQEKLANEKVYRKEVETARRYSVERERAAIVANAKATADNAELERAANQETWEAVADMIPKAATTIIEEKKRRDKFEEEAADAAIRRTGFTPEELDEYRQVAWTTEVLASAKYENLRKRLEAGGMSFAQFHKAIQGQGIWGRRLSAYDVMQRAKSGSTLLSQAVTDGWTDSDGNKLGQILSGEVPGNNRQGAHEWLREWELNTFRDYDPRFVEEVAGEDIQRFKDGILAKANEKEQQQALREHKEAEYNGFIGLLGSNSYQTTLSTLDNREAYTRVKTDATLLANNIKSLNLAHDSEYIDKFLNTKIWNPSLNGGKGGYNRAGDDSRIAPLIEAARSDAMRTKVAQGNASRAMDNEADLQLYHDHKKAIDRMSYDDAHRTVNELLADPDVPHSVKAKLADYITATDAPQLYKNRQVAKNIDEAQRLGLPVTPGMLRGATGQVYHNGQKIIAAQNDMSEFDKIFKGDSKTWVDKVTGRKNDLDTGHDDFNQVHFLLQRKYKQIQTDLKKSQGTNGLTDLQIHNKALKEVEEEWRAGTDENIDENARTGTFRYISGGDPTKGEFTSIYQMGVARVQPKISEAHKKHGAGFSKVPEAIFTKNYTQTLQEGVHKLTRGDWDRATDVAQLEGITAAEVIVRQMEANGHAPPAALVQQADAQRTLLKTSSLYAKPLSNAHLLGEQLIVRTSLETVDRIVSGKHEVTSEFGMRSHPTHGGWGMHYGIDLAGAMGAQQFNAHVQMKVIDIEYSNGGGHGYTAEFYVGDQRVVMRSLHHQKILAREGQVIPPGGIVALIGSTGTSTGPHMHLEFYIDGKPVDPRSVLGGIPLFEYIGPYWHKNEQNPMDFT